MPTSKEDHFIKLIKARNNAAEERGNADTIEERKYFDEVMDCIKPESDKMSDRDKIERLINHLKPKFKDETK